MASLNFASFLSIAYSLFFIATAGAVTDSAPVVKEGYYPSWAFENFPPSAIDTSLFTHIIYAFLVPNSITFRLDIANTTATRLSNFTTTIHRRNPHMKALYSIGGSDVKSDPFAAMAANASFRGVFIRETIEVARRYGFDGVDLDWEFPQNPKEMGDFGFLLKEWRHAIQMEANITKKPPLLLTVVVYYSVNFSVVERRRSYPAASIKNNLDWINVVCYNYHGSWDTSETGAHAALFNPNTNLSSVYGLKSWLKAGVPGYKLVMGLPLYGKTWKLKDPNVHGVGAATVDVGPGDVGSLPFSQVVEFNRKANATKAYDLDTASVYSYSGTTWVGYDDPLTTTVKIGFAQALGLRGYFFWAISYDYEWRITEQASRSWILDK